MGAPSDVQNFLTGLAGGTAKGMEREQELEARRQDRIAQQKALNDMRLNLLEAQQANPLNVAKTNELNKNSELLDAKKKALLSAPPKTNAQAGRGYMSLVNVVADPQDRRRLTSVEPAIQTHNSLVDLYNAYHSGDQAKTRSIADTLYSQLQIAGAKNDNLSPYFQNNMPSRDNVPAIYEAARKLAAAEQNKLVSGSIMSPSDIGRKEFAENYPALSAMPQTAQGQFDNITRTLVLPAMTGLRTKVQGYKNWKSNPMIPAIAGDYENMLNGLIDQTNKRIKNVEGWSPGTDASGIMPQPSGEIKIKAVREIKQ
jgi:hypothetical protein